MRAQFPGRRKDWAGDEWQKKLLLSYRSIVVNTTNMNWSSDDAFLFKMNSSPFHTRRNGISSFHPLKSFLYLELKWEELQPTQWMVWSKAALDAFPLNWVRLWKKRKIVWKYIWKWRLGKNIIKSLTKDVECYFVKNFSIKVLIKNFEILSASRPIKKEI